MATYTIDASVRLYGIEVEADSADDAVEIVRDALNEWMDETYVPMDPAEASASVDGIMGDEAYSKKPVRGSGGRSAPKSKACKGRAPARKTTGVRR